MGEPAAGDLSFSLAVARRQAADVVLPPPLLEGWSSLTAGEYAAAVLRLGAQLDALRRALASAAGLIPPA